MTRCNRPDCGLGDIDHQGFCPTCSRPPLPKAGTAVPRETTASAVPGATRARQAPWWGLDLVNTAPAPVPADEPPDPASMIPEERRFCKNCGAPVGRGHAGAAGRVKGFCPQCGAKFDFTQSRAGERIAGRYQVKRVLGSGGSGEALLAHDPNLGADVVLKDLSSTVAQTARMERDALVGLRHDSIVRIYDYEPDGPYLVLEYVRGVPLRAGDHLENILAHGLQILQALDYLHARGLLHMDVKPSNVIRFPEESADGPRDRVRLIDFGAVRTLGRPGPVDSCTPPYAPPPSDPEHQLPTAGFDLYCLGSTLRQLCTPHLVSDRVQAGIPALDRLLSRATDTATPQRRFVSARQFAEQLSGVIRQIVAAPAADTATSTPRPGRRITMASAIFGPMTEPLHGELGSPRPLGHWISARADTARGLAIDEPFAAPEPTAVLAALPAPLSDPDHPALTRSCEQQLAACRAELRGGDLTRADTVLGAADLPAWAWIHAWYSGLIALGHRDTASADTYFGSVRDALAGELIPLLALGICAEIDGRTPMAREHYKTAAVTAPALSAATFGLARTYLLDGQRDAAVAAVERLAGELQSRELRSENEARIAVIRVLAAVTRSCDPTMRDLEKAEKLLAGLSVDPDSRIHLRTEIQYGRSKITGDWLGLSEAIPDLARLASTRDNFYALMDLANGLRPPVRPWGLPRFRRSADAEGDAARG